MNATVPAASRTVSPADNIRPPLVTAAQLKADFAHLDTAVADLEAKAAQVPPVLEDDEDMAVVTAVATGIINETKRCEEARVEQNRPHLEAQKVINGHFTRGLILRLDIIKADLEKVSREYLRKKAAREQAARDAAAADARRQAAEAAAQVTQAVHAGDVPAATAAVTRSNSLADFAARSSSAAAAPKSDMARTRTAGGTAGLASTWSFEIEDINRIDLEALRPFLPQTAIEQALRAFIKSGRRTINGARIFEDDKARFRA